MAARSQILNVLGEQVSLEETGLAPGENVIVSFERFYLPPGFTEEQKEQLKTGLRKVFQKSVEPLPPCNTSERDLVAQSLKHRFGLLRGVLMNNKKDSQTFRVAAEHAFRLKDYVDFFESSTECSDEGAESALGRIEPLDDDTIQALIRQFVFLILQGENPLEKYQNADPNPKQFVQRLKDGRLTNFDEYLGDYRSAGLPIAARLAKLLEVADLDLNAITKLIDEGIKKKVQDIITKIKEHIPDPNDPMWFGVDMNDLVALFDRLLERIKILEAELAKKNETIGVLENQLRACKDESGKKDQEIKDLQARIADLEAQLAASKGAASQRNINTSTLQKAHDDGEREIQRLKGIISQLQADYNGLIARIPSLEAEIQRLHEEIDRLQSVINGLQSGPSEDAAKLTKELEAVKAQLNQKISNLGVSTSENEELKKKLAEKDAQIAQISKDLEGRINELLIANEEILKKDKEFEKLSKTFKEFKGFLQVEKVTKQTTINTLKTQVEKTRKLLAKELAQGVEDRKAAEDYVAELEAKIKELEAKIKELEAKSATEGQQTEAQTQKLQELSTQLVSLEQSHGIETEDLRKALAEAEQKISALQAEKAALSADYDKTIAALQEQLAGLQKKSESDERYKGLLTQRVRDLNTNLTDRLEEISNLKKLLEETREANSAGFDAMQMNKNSKMAELQARLNATLAELGTSKEARGILQSNLDKLKNEYSKLKALCDGNQAALDEHLAELETLKTQLASALAQAKELEGRAVEREADYDSLYASYYDMKAEKEAAEERATALQGEKDAAVERATTLQGEKEALQFSLDEVTQQLEAANARVEELEDLLKSEKEASAKLQAEKDTLMVTLQKLQGEKDAAVERATTLQGEKDAAVERATTLQGEKDAAVERATTLQGEKDAAEERAMTLQSSLDEVTQKLEAAEARVKELEDLLKSEKEASAKLQGEKVALKAQLEETARSKDAAYRQLEADYNSLYTSYDALVVEYNKLLGKNKNLEQSLASIQQELARVTQEKDQEIAALKAQVAKCNNGDAEKAALQQQLQQANKELAELIKKLEYNKNLAKDVAILQAEQINRLQDELEAVKQEKTFADNALYDIKSQHQNAINHINSEHQSELINIARKLALWIAAPTFPAPYIKGQTFYPVIEAVYNQLQKQGEEKRQLQQALDDAAARAAEMPAAQSKSEITTRHCYMLFFAAHTVSVHFPTMDESRTNMQIPKERISDIINSVFYGIIRGGVADVPGLFSDWSGVKKVLSPERIIMNTMMSLMDRMQIIFDSNQPGLYFFEEKSSDAKPPFYKEVLKQIADKLRVVLDKKRLDLQAFKQETSRYMDVRLGENGGHIENLFFYADPKGGVIGFKPKEDTKSIAWMNFANEDSFLAFKDNKIRVDKVPQNTEGVSVIFNNHVLTFPICFYMFLFCMKDYFYKIAGDLERECPIPQVLKI
jgi:chromosome segregation ATPase